MSDAFDRCCHFLIQDYCKALWGGSTSQHKDPRFGIGKPVFGSGLLANLSENHSFGKQRLMEL